MKIWVFAGGGEAEVYGLIPHFLAPRFPRPAYEFDRKTPVRRKPGPKPGKGLAYGKTGKRLAVEITERLSQALKHEPPCDLILIFDDLDCQNSTQRSELFEKAVNEVPGTDKLRRLTAFAAPELEAWLIADWEHTLAKHPDFRDCHQAMKHWLAQVKAIPFEHPESYSRLDPTTGSCEHKLSVALVEATEQATYICRHKFSKGIHTPLLLQDLDTDILKQKCPVFRVWYKELENCCFKTGATPC